MPVIKRNCIEDGFAQISNRLLQREDLTYETKGLLCELLSRPEDWVVYKSQLKRSHTGQTKIDRIFKEAQEKGYLHIENSYVDGKINERSWYVSSEPKQEWIDAYAKKSYLKPIDLKHGKPQFKETSVQGNQLLQIKTNTNKDSTNKETTEVKNTSVVSDKFFPTLAPECSESKQLTPEEIKAEIWSNFGECYDMYPGTKLLKSNMFGCFRKGCKVNQLDELEESRKLVPAVKEQIAHKQKLLSKGEFTPQWKTMSGWLANACWTEVLPIDPQEKAEEEKALRAGYQLSVAMGKTTLSYEEWLKPSQL